MKFPKIYLEITNVCNLSCSFCRGTSRDKAFMDVATFRRYAEALRPHTDYLYLHVMGEPLLHPQLDKMIDTAADMGFRVCLTTNGTLLPDRLAVLLARAEAIYKVSVSLHSSMANGEGRMGQRFDGYIDGCIDAAEALGRHGIIAALRLWNEDNPEAVGKAQNGRNGEVLDKLHKRFSAPWTPNRRGYKLGEGVYLEWGELFDWPTADGSLPDYGPRSHCFAMKDHVAVLCDGRVLPCCIDCDGVMPLGNLNEKPLSDILADVPAQDFLRSLAANHLDYPLCRHCNFK